MLTGDASLTPSLEDRSAHALGNDHLRGAVRFTVERLRTAKGASTEAFGNWDTWRELGRSIRAHTIQHLDYYMHQFSENARAQGAEVHFASDVADYFARTQELIRELAELEECPVRETEVMTNFERKYRAEGRPIHRARYLRKALPAASIGERNP